MPCQTQTSQQPQQPTTVLPQNLPKTQADWQRFLQRMNELLGSINNAQYATGVNAVPTEYAVYDGTALPALRITGATSAFDTAHAQFGVGSLKLTATASTITVELAASGYPITLHPNWKWIASLFLLTSAASITGKLSVVTPAQQYDVDISGSPGASWSRLYGDYDLTADASTSCTLLLTLTGVTIGQVFNVEGWMLEPSQGAVLPSPFIMTSGPRTWNQVVGSDAVNTNITTAQTTANTANTTATAANSNTPPVINPFFSNGTTGWSVPNAGWYEEAAGSSHQPDPIVPTYCVHAGSTVIGGSLANDVMPNGGHLNVNPGQIVTATCCIRELTVNSGAVARVYISWRNNAGSEIANSLANGSTTYPTCGAPGYGTYTQCVSRATGTAPAGAVYAVLAILVNSHTSGYFTFCGGQLSFLPSTLDEVPNGATYVSMIQQSNSAGALTVDNSTFQVASAIGATIPGWQLNTSGSVYYQSSSPAPSVGAQYVVVGSPSGAGTALQHTRTFAVNPGDSISVGGILYAADGTALLGVAFYTASGTYISSVNVQNTAASWKALSASGMVPSNAAYMTLVCEQITASSYAFFNYIWCTVNDLRVAGSGARVGDQRNLLQRTITNYPSKVSPGISYSASAGSPATATITAAAFTALLGSVSVSYNAASASVTGTNGTNVNYYLYFNDPTYSGGTHTLVATTNQNDLYSGDGYVYVGYVTVAFPSSGGGSGGGTGCPLRTAWVIRRGRHGRPQFVRAAKVRVGDWLLRTDGAWAEVTFSRAELQPCVRLVADGFGTLGCSVSAPMQLREGSALSIACLAREVVVSRAGTRGHAVVTDLHDLGDQWVQHITLANAPDDFFWTGDAKDTLFGHHNAKPP